MKIKYILKTPTFNKVWITSDTHFHHKNICRGVSEWKSGYRDFNTLEEMDVTLVSNINKSVDKQDVLIHLGDWSFGGKDQIKIFRDQIQCDHIIFLFGNHDHHIRSDRSLQSLFSWTGDYLELDFNKTFITLFHYPIASPNNINKGGIHLHGHCHGNFTPIGRMKDVGVDTNNFYPYLLQDVITELKQLPVAKVDHH